MNSTHAPLSVTRAERGQAWAVHLFTTVGIIFGGLALQAVLDDRPDLAIVYLMVTIVIDGVDGPIARALGVKERVPRINGYVLDLIIDFTTNAIVPAAFMYQFEIVPRNAFGLGVLGLMVLTSAIWFSRNDMMTDDNFFRGFPAAWNMIGPLLFLIDANATVGVITTIVLSLSQLTNMPYPHIMRATFLRPVTLTAAILWLAGLIYGAAIYPGHPTWLKAVLIAGSMYFVLLAVVKTVYDVRRRRHHQAEPKDEALASSP